LRTLLARVEHGLRVSPAGSRYHVARARLAAHEGDPAALAVHLEAAREAVRGGEPTLEAALVLADLALAAGEGGAVPIARAMAERARSEAEAGGVPLAIARAARAAAVVESRAAAPEAAGDRASRRGRPGGPAARAPFRLVTLGRFALLRGTDEAGPVRFERRKAPALLVALACAGEPLHRERLQEWFWPELPPARGLNALHTTLHGLRRALDPHLARGAAGSSLVSEGQAYRLHWGATDTWDAAEFLCLAGEAQEPCAPEVRIARLRAAEDAHVGRFLPDWPDADWSRSWRTRVEDAYHGTLERLADALLEAGRAAESIERYRRLVAIDPDREGWHRGLMRALARFGQRELALRQYEVCRLQLRRAHGAEPGPETRTRRDSLLSGGGARGPRPAQAAHAL
jgi:DNA-binding SARP family transcriptional activator